MAVTNAGIRNHEHKNGSTTEVNVDEGHGAGEEVDNRYRQPLLYECCTASMLIDDPESLRKGLSLRSCKI